MVSATIEGGLAFAIFGALTVGILVVIAFALTHANGGSPYDRIGAGGMTRESDYGATPAAGSPAADAEREREIRQMLVARSERLVRGGSRPLDVDAELDRLLAAESSPEEEAASRGHDPQLLAEVRQLVLARNERRIRQGQQPLDVDAEVARTLAELEP